MHNKLFNSFHFVFYNVLAAHKPVMGLSMYIYIYVTDFRNTSVLEIGCPSEELKNKCKKKLNNFYYLFLLLLLLFFLFLKFFFFNSN